MSALARIVFGLGHVKSAIYGVVLAGVVWYGVARRDFLAAALVNPGHGLDSPAHPHPTTRPCNRIPEPLRPFIMGMDFIPFKKKYDAKGKLVDLPKQRPAPAAAAVTPAASADGGAAMSTS